MTTRCDECGGPIEGWTGEHHSIQCSRGEDDHTATERDIAARYTRYADEDRAGGRNTMTRYADADACTP